MKKKLQVFVSSTFLDLKKERQAAVETILKAGHIPAGMELFSAGNTSQWETITKWIDESDAYMLILGGRYGSLEENSGLSYTELEFDYATSKKKPLFSVVMSDECLNNKVKADGVDAIEQLNSEKLNRFREKVLKNISRFFDDEKDIKLAVHESLADIASLPNVTGWISAADVNVEHLEKEIVRLNREKEGLQKRLDKAVSKVGEKSTDEGTFEELQHILSNKILDIPETLAGGKSDVKLSILDTLKWQRRALVNGVSNRFNANKGENFLFNYVCPELIIHNLSINEKVPGVNYRRSALSDLGLRFLSYLDKKEHFRKAEGSTNK
ncbi:DUF4062 domain-containing protein [Thalassospira sp. UBA1131]|uniref:DUF4062 domain-containing protein n=1 Tax=Thalassospira sp. UBA1131 TaxID=1947672 RepID=UPI0025F36451|nr:DUF4062 domain-containing protein [Thalassospira sp. UBA1131]